MNDRRLTGPANAAGSANCDSAFRYRSRALRKRINIGPDIRPIIIKPAISPRLPKDSTSPGARDKIKRPAARWKSGELPPDDTGKALKAELPNRTSLSGVGDALVPIYID
jgi:hypothetical protein